MFLRGQWTCPFDDHRAPGESPAKADEGDFILGLDLSLLNCFHGGNWDGGGGCVAVALDVDDKFIQRHFQVSCGGLDDSVICLVRNDPLNIVGGHI